VNTGCSRPQSSEEVAGGSPAAEPADGAPASPHTPASCLFQANPLLTVGTAASHRNCHSSTKKTQKATVL